MEGSIVPIVAKKADELSKPFSGAVAGTLAEFWNGIVGDRVVAWRLKNAAKVSEKLEKEVAERGLTLKTAALPESYAYRWFEKASEEDEPELQALFAKLLANAACGNEAALQRQNIDLVSRLTPDAAAMTKRLAIMYGAALERTRGYDDMHKHAYSSVGFDPYEVEDQLEAASLLVSLGVLQLDFALDDRLSRLLSAVGRFSDDGSIRINDHLKVKSRYVLTRLGVSLIEALQPERQAGGED